MEFTIIVAKDDENGIGKDGSIPWNCPVDRKFFSDTTRKRPDGALPNAVIMGRTTHQSIGKTLPDRVNIVISLHGGALEGVRVAADLSSALAIAKEAGCHRVFVIGGERVYRDAVQHPLCTRIIITSIPGVHKCDRFFPVSLMRDFVQCGVTNLDSIVKAVEYRRENAEEIAYLQLLDRAWRMPLRPSRTGIQVRGGFVSSLSFTLHRDGRMILPLLTTKLVSVRLVYEELLWFIRGGTEARSLQERNVHIWDGNSSREYLDSRNLTHYRVGELGPVYGAQLRHWGAEYVPECERREGEGAFRGDGIDQLQLLTDGLKRDPWGRRHLISMWNVSDIDKMSLPPCHVLYQFYVDADSDGRPSALSCSMYQRSADLFLGVPFNIASASLLTHMVAKVCGMRAERLVVTFGDFHIYETHADAVKEQLSRQPRGFPSITFSQEIEQKSSTLTVDSFKSDSVILHEYYPHPPIRAPMAV
jgi:dihydrofolate reductase/thymidylate synthase